MKVTYTPITPLSEYLDPRNAVQFVNDMKGTTWHECHKEGDIESYIMRLRSNGDYVIMEKDGSFNVKNLDGLFRYMNAWNLQMRRAVTRLQGVLYQEPDTVEAGSLSINTAFSYDHDGEERQGVIIRDSSEDKSPNIPVINLSDMSQQFVLKTRLVHVINNPTRLAIAFDRK